MQIFGTETQVSIAAWAQEALGTPVSDRSILTRAGMELAELVHAIEVEDEAKIGAETADVIIVLCRYPFALEYRWHGDVGIYSPERLVEYAGTNLRDAVYTYTLDEQLLNLESLIFHLCEAARQMSVNLPDEIDKKMKINRARKWKPLGAGHGQHVVESTPALIGLSEDEMETLRLAREYRAATEAMKTEWRRIVTARETKPDSPLNEYSRLSSITLHRVHAMHCHVLGLTEQ